MKQDTKEAEKLKELLAQAEGHPMMKAILAEKAAEVLAKRQEAALKIEALRKEQGEVIPRLQEAVKDKEAKYLTAKGALDALFDECRTARATLSSEGHQFDIAISQQEGILIESADARLDEAITFFRDKLDELRRPGKIDKIGRADECNLINLTTITTTETNIPAIKSALAYCQAAIKALEMLKLSPVLDLKWIEEMKAGIPLIDVFTETHGTGVMSGSWAINPRDLLKSDSQLGWELGKLNEKFQKWMRK